jgi:hypothetical protein
MRTSYEPGMSMREALARYFAVNHFGADGGYSDAWVDFKLGPIPMPFPNTPSRVKAVRYHDLHHIVTAYDTDLIGEFEISAWELAAGCKDMAAAWVLNLSGMFVGLLLSPRRIVRAWVRGRRTHTLYGGDYDALLRATVADVRRDTRTDAPASSATAADLGALVLAGCAGMAIGLVMMVSMLALAPVGLVMQAMRRRATAS